MHEKGEKERFRALTKGLKLGLGQNLEWEKAFGENKRFGTRGKRDRSRYLSLGIIDASETSYMICRHNFQNADMDAQGIDRRVLAQRSGCSLTA